METKRNGPRLRCLEKSENQYYATYKGCTVAVLRDHKTRPWTFLVQASDGSYLADGYTKEPMTMREAIIYAIQSAGLWSDTQ